MISPPLTEDLKAKIVARASAFDPARLVSLLASYGVPSEDVLFESNPERAGATIVDSVRFESSGAVVIRLNLGLLGDRGTLPSYFQMVVERGGATEAFHDFIRFFDHALLANLLRVTYPENDPALFEDWPRAVSSFRRMAVVGSEALLQSLLAKVFPELRVHVRRAPLDRSAPAASLVVGESGLDGGGLLGEGSMTEPNGFSVLLVALEASPGGRRRWPELVVQRLRDRVAPALEGQRIALDAELVVLDHEERAGLAEAGYLGYERVGGESSSVHRVRLFRGVLGVDSPATT